MRKTFLFIMLTCIICTHSKAENKAKATMSTLVQHLDSTISNYGSETYLAGRNDKTIYSYNPQNQTSEIKYYTWNYSSLKYELSKDIYYSYNSSNRALADSTIQYMSNILNGVYITKYNYNSDGTLLDKTYYSKETPSSSPFYAETIKYSYRNQILTSEEHSKWDNDPYIWTLFQKVIHYPDQNSNDTLVKTYFKNVSSIYLTSYTRNKITYGQNNNKTTRIKENINVSSSDSTSIIYAEKYEMTYDTNNNIITSYFSLKTSPGSNYSLAYRFDHTYDLNSNFIGIKDPIAFRLDEAKNKLTGYHVYSSSGSAFYPQAYTTFYYNNSPTAVGNILDVTTKSYYAYYRNNCIHINNLPANESKIKLSVYDTNGRRLISNAETNTENSLSMPNLPKGIYIYSLTTKTEIFKGKFIVE